MLLETLDRNTGQLGQLIERVIELSKLEEETDVGTTQSINQILDETVSAFKSLIKEQGKDFEANLGPDLSLAISEDSIRMVLNNLVSNALKYSKAGDRIKISTRVNEKGMFELAIEDSGQGIPEEEQAYLFDRFFRSSANSDKVIGTGLGLAITKEKIENCGGLIEVVSKLGEGSTFTVTLPIIALNNEAKFSKAITSERSLDAQVADSDAYSILVVEDNKDLLELLVSGLSEKFKVRSAENGEKAFELAKSTVPDLVVSDIDMPVMNGIELLKSIKNELATSHLPVILLTAKASIESRIQGWEHAADAYLPKPFKQEELEKICEALIKNREKIKSLWLNSSVSMPTNYGDELTRKLFVQLDTFLDEHIKDENLNVESMANSMFLAKRTFQRKIKAACGLTPTEYLKRKRLERAKQLLQKGIAVNIVAGEVGFSSPSYFSSSYKEYFGRSPSEENGDRSQ